MITSCFKSQEPPKEKIVETDYAQVLRLDTMVVYRGFAQGQQGAGDTTYLFIPHRCKFSMSQTSSGFAQRMKEFWMKEAKDYYGAGLMYKGIQYYVHVQTTSGRYDKVPIAAYDWRATAIDVVALTDWDADHPAGSSVKDKFCLTYRRSDQAISVPLSAFKFGDLMLADYIPGAAGLSLWPYQPTCCAGLVLRLLNPMDRDSYLQTDLEVRVTTDFGTEYSAKASDSESQASLCDLFVFKN